MSENEKSASPSFKGFGSDIHSSRLNETLNALRLVLQQLAAANKPAEVDSRRHFYNMFNREADEYDRDFHKKYHEDLNIALVFVSRTRRHQCPILTRKQAGLFSAVASAFIIDIQQELRPDYNEMSFTVLTMLLNTTSGIPNQLSVPEVSSPKASAVQVQSILFSSLASALLAAFLAMLGKQWLNLYVEGSLIDRSRHRELRMRGMITWRFKLVMECLPLVMQFSLLLLGYALARYVWDLSRTVSAVIAAFTVFGVLFYLFIVFAATIWKTCPFQTPASLVLRHITAPARKHRHRLREVGDRLSGVIRFRKLNESFVMATLKRSIDEELAPEPQSLHDPLMEASAVVSLEEDESTHASDTNCISTMFRFVSGSDAIVAVMGFILEVNWTSDVRRVPLLEVCHCLRRSFELLKGGGAVVRPGMRGEAYASARALLHLRVQRLCAGVTDNTRTVTRLLEPLLFGYRSKVDHELVSTLRVLEAVFNRSEDIPWGEFVLSDSHHHWLSHIMRWHAWVVLRTQESLPKDVSGFIFRSFSVEPIHPGVIANCLLVINMVIEGPRKFEEGMFNKDKRLVPHFNSEPGADRVSAWTWRTPYVKFIEALGLRLLHTLRPPEDSARRRRWSSWRP